MRRFRILAGGCSAAAVALFFVACGDDDTFAVKPPTSLPDAASGDASPQDAAVDPTSFFGVDQGMWPYDKLPKARIEQHHPELSLTDAFVSHLRAASAPLNNCSGSFISSDGLVLTNQHCVRSAVTALVTDNFDPLNNGYFASDLASEKKFGAGGPVISLIDNATDVTAPMLAGLSGLSERERNAKIASNKKPLVDACMQGLSAEKYSCVVTGRNGNSSFVLYKYRVYNDVRLVAVPPASGAHFASTVRVYDFPQWYNDFAFVRVYDNDQPLKNSDHFTWSTTALKEGDTVMLSGTPSQTSRGWSMAAYEFIRDNRYADWAARYQEGLNALSQALPNATNDSDRAAIQSAKAYYKDQADTYTDARDGMSRAEAVAAKKAMSAYVEAQINADPVRFAEFKDFYDGERKNAANLTNEIIRRYRTIDGWQLSDGGTYAFYFAKLADQLKLPDAQRSPSYHADEVDDEWKSYLTGGSDPNKAADEALWRAWLKRLAIDFAADADVTTVLGAQSTDALIASVLGSDMYNASKRAALYEAIKNSNGAVIDSTNDGALALMRKLLPADKRSEDAFNQVNFDVNATGSVSTRAHAAVFGDLWPAESASDLRLSFGRVKRFSKDGEPVQVATFFKEMFDLARMHAGEAGYELPKLWTDNESRFPATTQMVVATNADAYKGNSGSPVLNGKGEVLGVHYGSNPQGESRTFVYLDLQERFMMTTTQSMEAVMTVHGAANLLAEVRAGHR